MRFLCLAAALSVAACSSLGSNAALPIGSSADVVRGGTGTCKGSGGTSITPCQITLVRSSLTEVTLNAPGIASSALYHDGCHAGKPIGHRSWYCHIGPSGNSKTQWYLWHGGLCGTRNVSFEALNASGGLIGKANLRVANKYCQ